MDPDTTLIVKWAEKNEKKESRTRARASAGTRTFDSWVIDVLGLVTTGLCQYLRYSVEMVILLKLAAAHIVRLPPLSRDVFVIL